MRKLIENPDILKVDGYREIWSKPDAIPFAFLKGKCYIGKFGDVHQTILDKELKKRKMGEDDEDYLDFVTTFERIRETFDYPGRLWKRDKVISFWKYPPKSKFKTIIKKIEKCTGLSILNNNWGIEIVVVNGKFYHPKERSWLNKEYTHKVISLDLYGGSKKQNGIGDEHTKSPTQKRPRKVPKGVGSRKIPSDIKKGETMVHYHARTQQEQKLNEISNLPTSKRGGFPRGHSAYISSEVGWKLKIEYWRKELERIIGYSVIIPKDD